MKRIFYLIISALLLAIAVSCSIEEETFDLDIGSSTENDFGGVEVGYVLAFDSGNGVETGETVLGYVVDTLFSDLAQRRLDEVQSNYNCVVNTSYESSGNFWSTIPSSSAAGIDYCDVAMIPAWNTIQWAKAGYLNGIIALDSNIDYTDSAKWGKLNHLECMFYNNELYGLIPAAWPELVYASFGYPCVANMEAVRSAAAEDPREFAEQGNWTWDVFNEQLVKCTVVEGSETVNYGMAVHPQYFTEMMVRSNGVSFAEVSADGLSSCGFYRPAAMKAFEQARYVYNGDLSYTVFKDNSSSPVDVTYDLIEGVAAYSFVPTQYIFGVYGYVSQNLEDYAILPAPIGPDADETNIGGVYHTMSFSILFPRSGGETDVAAEVINLIYEPLEGYETQDDIKAYMHHNYFFDDRDADIYFEMFENSRYNYFYTTGGQSRAIIDSVTNSDTTITKMLESHEDMTNSIFEEYVNGCVTVYSTASVE